MSKFDIFSVQEKENLKKRKNENKITPEKYEQLLRAKREKVQMYQSIDNSLDFLEKNSNITLDQIIDKKIKLIEVYYEKESEKNAEVPNKFLEKQKEKLRTELRKKAEDKIPWIGWALFDWAEDLMKPSDKDAWIFDKIFWKIGIYFWTAILGIFWLKEGYTKLTWMKFKETDHWIGDDNAATKPGDDAPDLWEGVEGKEKLKKGWYTLIWRKFLEKVSPSRKLYNKAANNYDSFINGIEDNNIEYWRLKVIRNKLIKNSNNSWIIEEVKIDLNVDENLKISYKELLWMLDTLVWDNSQFVIKDMLKDIDSIIKDEKFRKSFWDNYDYLIWKDIWKIKFKDIEFLIGYSLPITILDEFKSILPDHEKLGEYRDTIEEEMKNRKDWFFSVEFLKIFWNWVDEPSNLNTSFFKKKFDDSIKGKTDNKKEELILEFDKFIKFKKSILNQLNDKKYNLWLDVFKSGFQESLTPSKILQLYLLFDWREDISNLSWVDKILMYTWIANIPKDTILRDKYLQELTLKSSTENNDYLTSEEQDFIIPLLKDAWYDTILKTSIEMSWSIKKGADTLLIKGLSESWILWTLDIDKLIKKYDIQSIIILFWLFGWSVILKTVPLPFHIKTMLSIWFYGFWTSYWIWFLKEKWFLDKIIEDTMIPEDIKKALENLKKEYEK